MPASSLVLPAVLGGVAAGILAAESIALAHLPVLGGIALTGIGLALRWRTLLVIGVALAAFGLGSWRSQAADPVGAGATSVATLVDGDGHEVLGTVVDDPRPREDRLQLVLGDLATANDGTVRSLGDKLLVWLPRGVDAGAGDRMLVDLANRAGRGLRRLRLSRVPGAAGNRRHRPRRFGGGGWRGERTDRRARGPALDAARRPERPRARARGRARSRDPARRAERDRSGDQRRVRDRRAHPRRRDLGLEHRDRRRPGCCRRPAAGQAPRRAMDHRGTRRHDRWRLRPPHRGKSVRRPRGAHGRGNARRPPRRLSRPRGFGAGPRGARHAAGRSPGAVGRRVPALAARDRRPRLLRGSGRAPPAPMAGLDPRAGRADARGPADDAAGDPRELRAALARRADRKRARRPVRPDRDALQCARLRRRGAERLRPHASRE